MSPIADYDLGTAKGKLVLDSSGVDKGVDSAGRSIDSLDGKSRNSAGSLRILEKALLAVGVAGIAAFAFAINKAADFEQSLSGIKAVSSATADQMELLRKKALKLGADTVFSAGDAALAMEELAKSGIKVEDILNGAADATVNLAAAGQISLPEAATIAANAMNQFGLAASDLPHVADLIAGAANASSIDVSDFGLSLAQAGAVANLTGLSFDDLALAVTAMGNAGIRGSDAGTSLKTFLTGLQPVTEKQKKLFEELGLSIEGNATSMNTLGNSFFDAQGHVKPMADIAGTLATALAGMSEQQKIATLETLFGSDAIRAAAIIAETGAGGFDTLAAAMGSVTAQDVAATRLDNFRGSLEQLKGSVETAAINVGTLFLPALRDVADFATVWVNKFSEMDEGTQKLIAGMALTATGAATLLGSIGLFAHAAAPAISGIGGIVGGVGSLGSSLVGALGPWGLLIAAVIAAIAALVALYFKFKGVRDVVDEIGRTIRDFALMVAEWFEKNIMPALRDFAAFFMDTIVPALQSFWATASSVIDAVVGFFLNVLVPGVMGAFNAVQDAILAFWGWFDANVISTAVAFIELFIAIFDKIRWFVENILMPQLRLLWAILGPIVSAALDVVVKVISFAIDVIGGIIGGFIDFIQKAWALFGDNIVAVFKIAFDIMKTIIETVLGIIRGIVQVVTGLISGDWSKAWEGIKTIFTTIWDAIKDAIKIVTGIIKLIIETFIDGVKLVLSGAWTAIRMAAQTAWDLIKLAITVPMELVAGVLKGIWDGLKSAASTAWNAVKSVIEPIINAIVKVIQKIIDTSQKAIDIAKKVGGFLPSTSGGDIPFVPFLARGGIIAAKTLAYVGEAGPEVVIPLDDPSRAMFLMMASGLGGMFSDNFAPPAPSFVTLPPAATSSPNMQGSSANIEGVHIDHAEFYDAVDIAALMTQADFAIQGAKL